jgi:putative peptidoglycan lipid II flippase
VHQVLALGLANAVGMSVIGVLLVLAVRRHAGPEALAGLGRATAAGIVAAVVAAAAGWATVTGVGQLFEGTPGAARSLVQGMLGGVVVLLTFAGSAFVLDKPDVRPLAETVVRRVRRGRAETKEGA